MIRQHVQRLKAGLARRWSVLLQRKVVWWSDEVRTLAGEPASGDEWIAILGREHYVEYVRKYPIRRWADLNRVVQMELAERPRDLAVIEAVQADERQVRYFELSENLDVLGIDTFFLIPETLLLAHAVDPSKVQTIERANCRYFLASSGVNQIAGGALRSAELFALASGVVGGVNESVWREQEIRPHLLRGLSSLFWTDWWALRSRQKSARVVHAGAIVGGALAGIGLAYLALASLYLVGMEAWRERAVAKLGNEVTALIAQQRAVDILASEGAGLAEVIRSQRAAWPVWELAAAVWAKGGGVSGMVLTGEQLVVRGSAPVATDVLASLGAVSGYQNAKFDTAVRPGGLGEEFVISLQRRPISQSAVAKGAEGP